MRVFLTFFHTFHLLSMETTVYKRRLQRIFFRTTVQSFRNKWASEINEPLFTRYKIPRKIKSCFTTNRRVGVVNQSEWRDEGRFIKYFGSLRLYIIFRQDGELSSVGFYFIFFVLAAAIDNVVVVLNPPSPKDLIFYSILLLWGHVRARCFIHKRPVRTFFTRVKYFF